MATWIADALAVVRALPPGLWMVAGLGVTGGTLARLALSGGPGNAAVALAQVVLLILLHFLLYRGGAGVRPLMTGGAPLWRFAGVLLGTILFTLVPLAVARALVPADARLADLWLWAFVATTVAQLLLLPVAPWLAALAVGDRSLGPAGGWWLLQRRLTGFAGAWLAVVSPCFAVHLMLTMLLDTLASTPGGTALIGVVFVDSAASLGQMVLGVGLGVAAWRLREGERAR